MNQQTPDQMRAILTRAIHDGHAVTLALGGQPIIAEPYALRERGDKTILTYWRVGRSLNDAGRIAQNLLGLITEVVDLGQSLDVLRAEAGLPPDDERAEAPRGPGRPRTYPDAREWVRVQLPVDLIAALDAATDNRTAFIERAIRAALTPAE